MESVSPMIFACGFCNHAAHTLECKAADPDCDCTQGLLAGLIPGVTMPLAAAGWLVMHALNCVPTDDDEFPTCCAACCGPCGALVQLHQLRLLEPILAAHGQCAGWSWWDEDHGRLQDGYLSSITPDCQDCTGPPPEDDPADDDSDAADDDAP